MLKEISNVRQIPEEGHRRWFTDDYFDLYLWYQKEGGTLTGFQLAYGETERSHALTWTKTHGYSHDGIDDGNITGGYKKSPILVANGIFDPKKLAHIFKDHAGDLEKNILRLIEKKIKEYS